MKSRKTPISRPAKTVETYFEIVSRSRIAGEEVHSHIYGNNESALKEVDAIKKTYDSIELWKITRSRELIKKYKKRKK